MTQTHTLDRESISGAIASFDAEAKVRVDNKKSFTTYHVSVLNEQEASIDVYHRLDGSTTLVSNPNKNYEVSKKICDHVVTHCKMAEIPKKSLYIKKLEQNHFDDLLEFLVGCDCNITDGSKISYGKQFKVTSTYGDYVVLNKYDSGSFSVQGSNKKAKLLVIEGLTNLLPYQEVITSQLESLDAEIDSGQAIDIVEQAIPKAYPFLEETLIAIISPSVALSSINVQLTDYSAFVFPALKGLEGYIKKLFLKNGILITNDGFGDYINTQVLSSPKVTTKTMGIISSEKDIKAIEKAYAYYRSQRHTIFHVDGTIEATRILESKDEAETIIKTVFNIIEETYTNIVT